MDKTTLLQRQDALQTQFNDLTNQINALEAQIQPLAEERARVSGGHREVTELVASFKEATNDSPVEGEVVPSVE